MDEDGSDGTRTRDLRRDRLVPRTRRLATIDALSLYSWVCELSALICARLRRLDFVGLLPFWVAQTLVEIDHDPMIEYQTQRLEYLSE